jgi:hypothetical protein
MPQPFANLEGLLQLSRTEGVDIRPALLRVLTDLYVQEPQHSREEAQQYLELALRLIPVVDGSTRAAVGKKLRLYPHTPGELLGKLDGEQPDARAELPAAVPAVAPETTAAAVAPRAELSRPQNISPPIVPPAASETPIGTAFLRATTEERWPLLARLDDEMDAKPCLLEVRPGAVERLERAALDRNQREYVRELQQSLALSGRIAWQIVLDEFGEPTLIVARALGMAPEVVLRILMFLNPTVGESVERVFALIRSYEQVTLEAAMAIVTSWRQVSRLAPTASYQSLHAPDAASVLDSAREGARGAAPRPGEQTAARPTPMTADRIQRTS